MNKILMTGICLLSAIGAPTVMNNTKANPSNEIPTEMTLENLSATKSKTGEISIYDIKSTKIYPDTLKQGETAVISVVSKEHLQHPYYIYGDKKIPIYQQNDSVYAGMIGTDPNTKAGPNKIILGDETKKLSGTLKFEVKHADFGTQNVTLSKSVSKLKATDDELIKIKKALNTKSDTAYFVNLPYEPPTAGRLSSLYGKRRYNNNIATGRYHNGIDIAASKGQAIKSIQGGKVLVAEQFVLNGGTVIVDHGHGMTSAYLHMSNIGVKAGQYLKANDIIGKVGSTGHSSGPHLHFGVYVNGTAVNPKAWLKPINNNSKTAAKINSQVKVALKSTVQHIR